METLPIITWLEQMDAQQRETVLKEQGMFGYMENHYPHLVQESQYSIYKEQRNRNLIHEQEALTLNNLLSDQGIKVIFLKGITLINDIYVDLGSRVMSDIDCYVARIKYEDLDHLLIPLGYHPNTEAKWLGNAHKREYIKSTDLGEVCIEFHNKLFWHRDDPKLTFRQHGLYGLGLEEKLVYLCGHYAFLHSCQKLYWLWDIYLFLRCYQDQLDPQKVSYLMDYFGFKKSFSFICEQLRVGFDFQCTLNHKHSPVRVRKEHYFSDRQNTWPYLQLKFALKDKLSDNVRYLSAYFLKGRV